VAGQERRIGPLQDEDPRARPARQRFRHRDEPVAQVRDQRTGVGVEVGAERGDAVQHAVEGVRVEGVHPDVVEPELGEGLGDGVTGQRAHPAEVLGDDDVGRGRPQGLPVQLVHRQPRRGALPHARVDLGRGHALVEGGADDDGHMVADPGRVVALEGHGDEVVGAPERAGDLGRRRQERGDPHGPTVGGPALHGDPAPSRRRVDPEGCRRARGRPLGPGTRYTD